MRESITHVLITDPIDQHFIHALRDLGLHVSVKKLSKEQLLNEIADYDLLIVRSGTNVTADVIAAGKNLKLIGRAGTGLDNVDVAAATRHSVLVMNTPGSNTISAAEQTCALILALARHIPQADASMKEGLWDRKEYMGNEIYGKTLAIIGLGRIGRQVGQRMHAFGMRIIGYEPLTNPRKPIVAEFPIELHPLDDICQIADYITVHTPLTSETENLINYNVLSRCKKGIKVINVARGGIINEQDLLRCLAEGFVGGAGLDVFTEEPAVSEELQGLIRHPRVISTPHLGASTREAQERVAQDLAEQIKELITTGHSSGLVNQVQASSVS